METITPKWTLNIINTSMIYQTTYSQFSIIRQCRLSYNGFENIKNFSIKRTVQSHFQNDYRLNDTVL